MNDFAAKILMNESGKTSIYFVGQAGFIIKSRSGQTLGVDLYLTDCVERIEGHVGYHRLLPKILAPYDIEFDILIATHPHKDHFDDDAIPLLMSNGNTKLFASLECEKDIKRLLMKNDDVTYVVPDDNHTIGDFRLDFIRCDHGTGAPDAVGVIVFVDGFRILFVGDTCLRLDRSDEYLKDGRIDVLIAPINGAYGNLNEEECAVLAAKLKPGLTVPCHYGMFASHGGNPEKFLEAMRLQCSELPVKLMSQGERIILEWRCAE